MIQNHDLKVAVDHVLDVFHDGVAFSRLCAFINRMDELAKKGDKPAQQILEQVRRFHRLVNVATN